MANHSLNSIKRNILIQQKKEIIKEAKDHALAAVEKHLTTLPQEIENHITKAIKNNLPRITLKHKGYIFLKNDWQETYIPPIITGIITLVGIVIGFGFWTFYQSSTMERMSIKEKEAATELSLKEEYTKRQFDAYEEANTLMSDLIPPIRKDALNPDKKTTPEEMTKLERFLQKKAIYLPEDVEKSVEKVKDQVIDYYTDPAAGITANSIVNDINTARGLIKQKMEKVSINLDEK